MAMPKTLLELAVENLQENFNLYDRHLLQRILVPFHTIKEMTRTSFHRKSHKHCEAGSKCNDRLFSALPLWMKFFHAREFASSKLPICKKSFLTDTIFSEFIRCLPLITPDLTTFHFAGRNWNLTLGEIEVNAIVKLTQLTSFTLDNVSIPLSGFLKIVEHCENLEYLVVDISIIDVEMQSSLMKKGFLGWLSIFHQGQLKFMLHNKLPSKDKEHGRVTNRPLEAALIMEPQNILELKVMLRLHMHTQITRFDLFCKELRDDNTLDQFPYFPYVKCAEFDVNSIVDNESLRVRQMNSNSIMFRSFLRLNGGSLLHLKLAHLAPGQVTLEQLSGWCPNLKSLTLGDCSITSDPNVPIKHFSQLQEFYWTGGKNERVVPIGFILSAPLLRRFEIHIRTPCIYDFGDSDALVGSIARREILCNLVYYSIENISYRKGELEDDEIFKNHLIEVIKTMSNKQKATGIEKVCQ